MHGARVPSVSLTGIERSSIWTAGDAQEKLPSGTRSNFFAFSLFSIKFEFSYYLLVILVDIFQICLSI